MGVFRFRSLLNVGGHFRLVAAAFRYSRRAVHAQSCPLISFTVSARRLRGVRDVASCARAFFLTAELLTYSCCGVCTWYRVAGVLLFQNFKYYPMLSSSIFSSNMWLQVGGISAFRGPAIVEENPTSFPSHPTICFVFFDVVDPQELMGSLLWAGKLEVSPYSHLLSADLWTRVKEAVVVDGSRVSGLSRESVLSVAFRVSVGFILHSIFRYGKAHGVGTNHVFMRSLLETPFTWSI